MQNVVPKILDHLVDKGKIDPLRSEVYQEIMLDTTVPLQKARKLLAWLAAQPPKAFWTFQHAIRQDCLQTEAVYRLAVSEKEMRELMGHVKQLAIPEQLNLMRCHTVLKVREQQQKAYRSRDKLLMSAGLAKGKTMTMDKILVNVCLLSSEEAKKAFEKPSFSSQQDRERCEYLFSTILQGQPSFLSLEEVFKAKQQGEKDPNKVMASGGAGCGKSVCFTRKAPYDWANGDLWQQFALLFCLELRDKSVWQAKTLAELLRLAELDLSPDEQREVHKFIIDQPDKVVIVCDGLDEGSIDESSLLWRLLCDKCTSIPSNLHIVVTTRPCNAAGNISQATSYRGVEVVGFTEKDVAVFACKYLGEEAGKKLIYLLDNQRSIASLMHAPLFCLLVCDLFQESRDLPSTRTGIFEKIVVALLHRFAKAHCMNARFHGWADAPAHLRDLVVGLGKVAYRGLQKKQLYFSDAELEEAGMPEAALELGFLTKADSADFWKRDEYAFSHLTLQEFLAALYVSSEVLQTEADVAKLLEEVGFDNGHLSTFWVFLASLLSGDKVEALLRVVIAQLPRCSLLNLFGQSPSRCTYTRLIDRCFVESHFGKSSTPSRSVSEMLEKYGLECVFDKLSVSDCVAISIVLHCHSAHVHNVSLRHCFTAESGLEKLLSGLQDCKSIKTLDVRDVSCGLTRQATSSLSTVLDKSASTLGELRLSGLRMKDDHLEMLAKSLAQCKNLKVLDLSRNLLTWQGGATLCKVLSCLPSLEVLGIAGNILGDIGLERMAEGLKQCTSLKTLDMKETDLTSLSGSTLSVVVSSLPSLGMLCLDFNKLEDSGVKELVSGLQLCTQFQRLDISENGLSSRSFPVLSRLDAQREKAASRQG